MCQITPLDDIDPGTEVWLTDETGAFMATYMGVTKRSGHWRLLFRIDGLPYTQRADRINGIQRAGVRT